ncbi:MAG: SDR family oxidoreductase [Clostridia bacterium]|jgi:short-subunit dehydrogenase|nr:SDR family oxidoreductase [Clostridia bacterium]MDD4275429.1 SDR family NAD(P)-dependent oxidoreductase [Clostridia bacterium]
MEFQNKVFAVTGGGNGIGREVVLLLLNSGASVAAIDISEDGLNQTMSLAKENGKFLTLHKVDITNKSAVEALPDLVLKAHNAIDGVINVAGIIQPFISVNELKYEQIERVMNINFYGTLYMVKSFLPHLIKKETMTYVANVSSMGGFLPVPGQSIYGASKAAVKLMTEGLYAELKDTNVRVSIILPGAVATNITKNSNVEMKPIKGNVKSFKMTTAVKAAQIIVEGIEKNKLRIIVGGDSRFMDFLYRLCPKKAIDMIAEKMKSLIK